MLTSARIPEPRDSTEPSDPPLRGAAWLRAQPRPVQALIAVVALAVLAGVIGLSVHLVGSPGEQPQAQQIAEHGAAEAQAPDARRMVEPPAEARPMPISAAASETAEEPEPEAAVAALPAEAQAAEMSDIQQHDSWLRARSARPRFGTGGGTYGVVGDTFDGGRQYIPAPLDEARQAIRAYIGAGALEPLPMSFKYAVRRGDNMASIAQRFGLQIGSVRINNMHIDDPNLLPLDAELEIPVRDGLLYTVRSGDTLDGLVQRYEADKQATIAFDLNALVGNPNAIRIEQRLLLVGGTRPDLNGAYFAPLTLRAIWYMPVEYERITDPYGTPRPNYYGIHTGVDFAADNGAPVRAARAGTVLNSGWDSSYGNWVEIDHGGEIRSRYAHLASISVVEGQWVAIGQVLGRVGSTGYSTGPHLHFEILRDGHPINPHPALGLS